MEQEIEVLIAGPEHEKYVDTILETIADAAKVRGTGIAKRTHEYLAKKMLEAKAVIALTKDGQFAGLYRKNIDDCVGVNYLMLGMTSWRASITSWCLMPSLITMKMVSSPAMVPMISGMSLLSMFQAMALA